LDHLLTLNREKYENYSRIFKAADVTTLELGITGFPDGKGFQYRLPSVSKLDIEAIE